jgi:uncharacterized membrane protein YeaQ/YmgE (transglycosylase-associated protein family)
VAEEGASFARGGGFATLNMPQACVIYSNVRGAPSHESRIVAASPAAGTIVVPTQQNASGRVVFPQAGVETHASAKHWRDKLENPQVGWIAAIIIGGVAGWLAEMFMKSNVGLLMNIILGIVGAVIANALLGLIGVSLGGWIGYLIAGFIGACILIAVARMIKR